MGAISAVNGCASPTLVALDDSWFECTRARQCEILEDPACRLIPINKHYAKPFAQHVRIDLPGRVAKGACPKQQARYRVECEAGRCTSDLRGLVRRRGARAGKPAPEP